jgi:membrane protein
MSSPAGPADSSPAASPPVPPFRSPAGQWLLVRRTAVEFWKDRVLGLSAEAAFWQLLSLPPVLLAVMGTIGYFGPQLGAENLAQVENSILNAADSIVSPRAIDELVRPGLHNLLTNGRADVVSIGFLLALWTGSTAMATFVNTITIAYDLRDARSAVKSRLLALWLFLGQAALGVVLLPALILGPGILERLAPASAHQTLHLIVVSAYWPVVVLGSLVALSTLYHLAVPARTRWTRGLPGATFALALWLLGSFGLRLYLTYVIRAQSAYGSLAAPIAVLLFFYITALAVLAGAELNAEIDKLWPSPATAQLRNRLRRAKNRGAPALPDGYRSETTVAEEVRTP